MSLVYLWHSSVAKQNTLCEPSLEYILRLKVIHRLLEFVCALVLLDEVTVTTLLACLVFFLYFYHSGTLLG